MRILNYCLALRKPIKYYEQFHKVIQHTSFYNNSETSIQFPGRICRKNIEDYCKSIKPLNCAPTIQILRNADDCTSYGITLVHTEDFSEKLTFFKSMLVFWKFCVLTNLMITIDIECEQTIKKISELVVE